MDVIRKHSLAMDVALNLEHELSTSHSICDLEGFEKFVLNFIYQVKAEHEGFLF